MPDSQTVRHGGVTYEIERHPGGHVTPGAPATGGTEVWELTRGGATVTSFPVSADDTDASIREKVMGWLRANQDRPATDIGRN